jgi:hypothetical protein
VFRGLKEFAIQFFYMRHCAFAHRATISVVPRDCYPIKTLATGPKREENSPEAQTNLNCRAALKSRILSWRVTLL